MSVGTPEILVILLVALLVFGPQRLPEVGRQVGAAIRELRKIQDTVRGEMDMVLNPEHGTRTARATEEPGDHTYDAPIGNDDEHVAYGEGGYVGNGNGVVGQEDLGNGLSDFTPPDYRPPDPKALDAPADTDPGFRGPPDSFI